MVVILLFLTWEYNFQKKTCLELILLFLIFGICKDEKKISIDWEDEIIAGTCLTRDGKIVHPALQPKDETPPDPKPAPEAADAADAADDATSDDETSSETGA